MIDADAFAAGMGILAGNFGREVDGAVSRAWYTLLSPKMTTREFERAVQLVLESETYWPSAALLLAKIRIPADDQAEQALRELNSTLGQFGGFQHTPYAALEPHLDGPTKAALNAIGGLGELAATTEEKYPRLVKKWVAAYNRAKPDAATPKLPQPKTDPAVMELIADLSQRRGA